MVIVTLKLERRVKRERLLEEEGLKGLEGAVREIEGRRWMMKGVGNTTMTVNT
jgi:hypothetical protein